MLVVPTAAVLYDEQNLPFVYVQVEPGKFAQRLVKLGAQQDDQIEILDGLKAGRSRRRRRAASSCSSPTAIGK